MRRDFDEWRQRGYAITASPGRSRDGRPGLRLRRLLAPLMIALAVLTALLLGMAWIPVLQARNALRHGRTEEAARIAARWEPLRVWPQQWEEVRLEILRNLFAQGRYGALLDSAAGDRSAEAMLLRGMAQASLKQVVAASQTLEAIDPSKVDRRRYAALRSVVAEETAGAVPVVFDRNGGVLAIQNLKSGQLQAVQSDFAPLIDPSAGKLALGSRLAQFGSGTIDSTLDPFVQKAALEALGSYRGSIVAIDPRTNEILAIANHAPDDLALEADYEPGSVIKVLTGLAALNDGVNVDAMFPYFCRGELTIDGRQFGDWVPQGHGNLTGIDDALAVSCNIFFADLGLRLGRDKLERFLRSAGFDGQANLGLFQAPLGRLIEPLYDNFDTAFLSIGLQHERINALHLAMLASMMANRGVLTTPRLLRGRRSLFGDPISGPPQQGRTRIAGAGAAERMIAAMQAVAYEPHGTGRRAPVEGLPIAMKTGTAGRRSEGYQAVIMAFAPVESPKIAFAIIAENAGPAEFAGAEIAHDFLERIRTALK